MHARTMKAWYWLRRLPAFHCAAFARFNVLSRFAVSGGLPLCRLSLSAFLGEQGMLRSGKSPAHDEPAEPELHETLNDDGSSTEGAGPAPPFLTARPSRSATVVAPLPLPLPRPESPPGDINKTQMPAQQVSPGNLGGVHVNRMRLADCVDEGRAQPVLGS